MDLQELERAQKTIWKAYREAKDSFESLRRKKIEEATRQIDLSLADERKVVSVLYTAEHDAQRAVEDERVRLALEGAQCKWAIGTKMKRVNSSRSWARDPKIEYGIIEVVTRDTEFPENTASYNKPSIGSVILRLCNKDGKPGKRIEGYWRNHNWEPAE